MDITMNDSRIVSITQLEEFLKGSLKIPFSLDKESVEGKYEFIEENLKRFSYRNLKRKEKRIILWYLRKVTGYKKESSLERFEKQTAGTVPIVKPNPRFHFTYSIRYDFLAVRTLGI